MLVPVKMRSIDWLNTNHSDFTGKTGDWVIKWTEGHTNKSDALKREKQIKAWKGRKMIEKLIDEV